MRISSFVITLIAAALFACAPNETEVSDTGATVAAVPADTAGDTAATGVIEEEQVVTVTLANLTIDMPEKLAPGPVVLKVQNLDDEEHSLVVDGGGAQQKLEGTLKSGETKELRVELPGGTYQVYCPVADHAERGMRRTLTVG